MSAILLPAAATTESGHGLDVTYEIIEGERVERKMGAFERSAAEISLSKFRMGEQIHSDPVDSWMVRRIACPRYSSMPFAIASIHHFFGGAGAT
jgi:hypothetical protein